jgi:hypothetical protein
MSEESGSDEDNGSVDSSAERKEEVCCPKDCTTLGGPLETLCSFSERLEKALIGELASGSAADI